ncbi:hypothetical protein BaRGS_00006088 [Batillaria attramentaria]|uniref:Uncharacterized protein n=1 Tax=Batillaria attramentaria TaxID=370345 RepID=A0ABD0LTX8_9CAEN
MFIQATKRTSETTERQDKCTAGAPWCTNGTLVLCTKEIWCTKEIFVASPFGVTPKPSTRYYYREHKLLTWIRLWGHCPFMARNLTCILCPSEVPCCLA